MAPIYPFSVLRYNSNPLFAQPLQSISIGPQPGSTSINYAITSGTLPSGLTLNATTGIISGSVASITPPSTIVITGTLPNTTTVSCSISITITNIPNIAPIANYDSATDLTALKNQAESNFISAAFQMIQNNNQLGLFQAYFDVPLYASINSLMTYFQNLGYTFTIITQAYNTYQINYPWLGEFYDGYPYSLPRFAQPYGYGTRPGYSQQTPLRPRVMIGWFSTPVCPQAPYYQFPNN